MEYRVLRRARDCWEQITHAESFDSWAEIGRGLSVGKQWALRTSGANRAWGSTYSRAFSQWMERHGFGTLRPSDRSYAILLNENLPDITLFRNGLPEHRRRRLVGAQANVKAWRKTTHPTGPKPTDLEQARAAWRRFVSCMKSLPADADPLVWQVVLAEAHKGLPQSRARTGMARSGGAWVGSRLRTSYCSGPVVLLTAG
jgi:hypothetical protein